MGLIMFSSVIELASGERRKGDRISSNLLCMASSQFTESLDASFLGTLGKLSPSNSL